MLQGYDWCVQVGEQYLEKTAITKQLADTLRQKTKLTQGFVLCLFCPVLIKICSSSEDLSEYKISCPYVDWCKFCIHFKSVNVRHFEMVAATA
jgi:hypothetical protein